MDHDLVDVVEGELRDGIVAAHRRDDAVRVLDAHRPISAGREQVDHLSADRHLARLVDALVEHVSLALQGALEILDRDRAARRQPQALSRPDGLRRHALDERVGRGDHDARAAMRLGQAGQGDDPPAHHLARGRRPVVGQAVPGRKNDDGKIGRQILEDAAEGAGAALAARDMDDAARSGLLRKIEETQGERANPRSEPKGRARRARASRAAGAAFGGSGMQG